MMRAMHFLGVACVTVVVLPVAVHAAETDDAVEALKAIYDADLKRVKATADTRDDVDLAVRLLAAAKKATDQPEFVAVLCEKACDLAGDSPKGIPTAVEALDLLARTVPDKAAACAARMVAMRQKQFDASGGDEQPEVAEALIDALLAAADAKIESGALLEAAVFLVRARNVARAVTSPRQAELETRAKTLTQRMAATRKINDLKALIEKNPQNVGAREGLVRLYLVDLDDPAEAARHLEGVKDKALLKYVPAAAKGVKAPPELACLQLGDWYRDLASKAPPHAKPLMYARAKAYLERFLKIHTAEDLGRTRATLTLEKIEQATAKLAAAKATPTPSRPRTTAKAASKGGWINLLALVDPAKDSISGKWEARRGSLTGSADKPSSIAIPVTVEASYRLSVTFARTSGSQEVMFFLPVGKFRVVLALGRSRGEFLNAKPRPEAHTVAVLENHRSYQLEATVTVEGDQADITFKLDGREHLRWKGPQSALSVPAWCAMPRPKCFGLGGWRSVVAFSRAHLEVLSGKAELLR